MDTSRRVRKKPLQQGAGPAPPQFAGRPTTGCGDEPSPPLHAYALDTGASGELTAWHYRTRRPVRIRWQAGVITEIEPAASAPEGRWAAPALFDAQVNGFGGVDFQQDDLPSEALLSAVRRLRASGCGRFLPTLITDEWGRMMRRLAKLRALRLESPELTAAIPGWHIEGPFLSCEPGFCGTHNANLMRDPRPADIRELRAVAGDDLVVLTMAPERQGALEAIALAAELGIRVSLGHTNASSDVLRRAMAAGAFGFTHLGNGCPSQLDRHDNILWRALELPGLAVSLIPDRIHLSPPLFRLIHRWLEPERIFYITDAISAAGAVPGRYRLGSLELEVGADQVVRQPGKSYFSGSALCPLDGVSRAAEMLGCAWQEAWARFSETPAAALGLRNTLAPGQPASFCIVQAGPGDRPLEARVLGAETPC